MPGFGTRRAVDQNDFLFIHGSDDRGPRRTNLQQDPRFLLNFCISGLFYVECTDSLYHDNPDIQNSAEIGDLAVYILTNDSSIHRVVKTA